MSYLFSRYENQTWWFYVRIISKIWLFFMTHKLKVKLIHTHRSKCLLFIFMLLKPTSSLFFRQTKSVLMFIFTFWKPHALFLRTKSRLKLAISIIWKKEVKISHRHISKYLSWIQFSLRQKTSPCFRLLEEFSILSWLPNNTMWCFYMRNIGKMLFLS